MLNKTVSGLMAVAFLLGGLVGCKYDNLAELHPQNCDATDPISFANDIVPIMNGSCSSESISCHGTGNFNNALLNDYTGVKEQVDNGKLLSSITWDGVATQSKMPSGSSTMIDACSIEKIDRWINAGAPNN